MPTKKDYNVQSDQLGPVPSLKQHRKHVQRIINNPSLGVPDIICGVDQYISVASIDSSQKHLTEQCMPCSGLKDILTGNKGTIFLPDFFPDPKTASLHGKNYKSDDPYEPSPTSGAPNFKDPNPWDRLRSPSHLAKMCHSDPLIYVPAQYEANYSKQTGEIGTVPWDSITPIPLSATSPPNQNLYKKWFTDRIDDETLKKYHQYHLGGVGAHGRSGDIPPTMTFPQFKEAISDGRGSIVSCPTSSKTREDMCKGLGIPSTNCPTDPITCSDPTGSNPVMGSNNIIDREYIEWQQKNDFRRETPDAGAVTKDLTNLWKDLGPPNSNFENCMNEVFGGKNLEDQKLIKELKNTNRVKDIKPTHIKLIKKLLYSFLAETNKEAIHKCITTHIYLAESVCDAPLHTKMLNILSIILVVIGYNMKLVNVGDNLDDRRVLMVIIDELGDLIPLVIKRIIDISKYAEINSPCPGGVTPSTKILDKLYHKLFVPDKRVFSFDLGISDMITNASNKEFDRTTVLAIMGIAFLKFF